MLQKHVNADAKHKLIRHEEVTRRKRAESIEFPAVI
jgi:hypothetical protein